MYCRSCTYPLQGLDGNRCPECGLIFDAADVRTFRRTKTRSRRVVALTVATLLVLVLAGVGYLKGPDWWAGYKRAAAERQLRQDKALFDAAKRGDVAGVTQCLVE